MQKEHHIGYVVIFWCIMVSFIYIFAKEGINKMDAEWIALVVALVGVAGGIWAQIVQFKKDAQRIERVNDISEDIRKDTTEIKPKIQSIKDVTKEINDCVTRRMEPEINKMLDSVQGDLKDNIVLLADDLKYRQRLENEYKGIRSRAMIEGGVRALFEDNAVLSAKVHELQKEKENWLTEKEEYIAVIASLKAQVEGCGCQAQPELYKRDPNIKR